MANSFIGRSDLHIGLRNNNPGNIRPGEPWQGKIGEDGGFIVFLDITYGTRALAKDLNTKITKGLDTIRSIITQYAPASDNNDVAAYITSVSNDTGIGPDEQLGNDPDTLHSLVRAIMNHENGNAQSALVTDQDIDTGISMMGANLSNIVDVAKAAIEDDPGQAIGIGSIIAIIIIMLLAKKR